MCVGGMRTSTTTCSDLEEYEDLGRGLELATRSMVFLPVNNAAGPFSRGSHW